MAYSRAPAAMDVWPSWLAHALRLEETYLDQLCLRKTGGRYQLTSHNYPPETGQNALEHSRQGNPCFYSYGPVQRALYGGCILESICLSTTCKR